MSIAPHWAADGKHLRYQWETPAGSAWREVDLTTGASKAVSEDAAPTEAPRTANPVAADVVSSPNGRWGVRVAEGNLYRVDLGSGEQTRLTSDAEPDYAYGLAPQRNSASLTARLAGTPIRAYGLWSPEGDRFLTYRIDERALYKLPHMVPIVPGAEHQVPYVHFQNTAWPAPIQPQDQGRAGHRDTLVLTYRAGGFQGDSQA